MEISSIVATNLKRLRKERNLSLGQLATLSEVSKVMLSQIENGSTNPTINTLWKIAGGLKVPYTALLTRMDTQVTVMKKPDLAAQSGEDAHSRIYNFFASTPDRNFELFLMELDVDHGYDSVGHLDKSYEYIMVLEGTLELEVENHIYRLESEEAIGFPASQPHRYYAVGNGMMKAVVINYYSA